MVQSKKVQKKIKKKKSKNQNEEEQRMKVLMSEKVGPKFLTDPDRHAPISI